MSGDMVELGLCARQAADPGRGRVAQERYPILVRGEVAGQLRLRLQDSEELVRHAGHVGYDIAPGFRGHGHAAAAVRLILPRARAAGLAVLWITCDPANTASRRTAERAGAKFIEVIGLPPSSELYRRGERQVARYRLSTDSRGPLKRTAVYLSGPIGAGKSTIGALLAERLGGTFVEGDEHAGTARPWYGSSLSTARSILGAVLDGIAGGGPVVVAYPLRCIDWLFHRRRLAEHGVDIIVVSLAVPLEKIVDPIRGREFSNSERTRIARMIDEGYCDRFFSDITLRTSSESVASTLSALTEELGVILKSAPT